MTTTTPAKIQIPQVPIPPSQEPLFTAINAYVYTYMSQYDNSHDYQHILRVLSNTQRILQAETKAHPSTAYDTTSLFLAALLHDVGDHKYTSPDATSATQIHSLLTAHGAAPQLATKVQTLVTHVSYTNEVRDPQSVSAVLAQHPELAIVQDADRLDAIGAIGIGRCFSYGAARFPDSPMDRAIEHFEEKLYRLEGLMKTESGKAMAVRRTDVLKRFAEEWREEEVLSFELR